MRPPQHDVIRREETATWRDEPRIWFLAQANPPTLFARADSATRVRTHFLPATLRKTTA
jgi:hypothetical protein